jgi:hypothetical protein
MPPRVDPHHAANVMLLRTLRAGFPDVNRAPDEGIDPYLTSPSMLAK